VNIDVATKSVKSEGNNHFINPSNFKRNANKEDKVTLIEQRSLPRIWNRIKPI
jgi:hypothetical protein